MAVGTTRGKRRLGRYVRPIRVRSGLGTEDVATRAHCSRQTVTRLESGVSLPRIHLFLAILGVIGATDDEKTKARQLWDIADATSAAIEHADELPATYRRFRLDESEAVRERTLDIVVFPGLLATGEYASRIAHARRHASRTDDWESHAAAERRERQALLRRPGTPLELQALVDESVLTREVGDPAIMERQLDHVLIMAELPNVAIKLIPKKFGEHGAMSGPLTILSYTDDEDEAYAESVLGVERVGKPNDVATLSAVWDEIAAAALPVAESVEFIRETRNTLKG